MTPERARPPRTSALLAKIRDEIQRLTSVERLAAAEILAGAILIRLLYLRQPIRHDEAYTYLFFASEPLGTALGDYSIPNNHLFHTLLVRATTAVLGGSLPAIRLPAFTAGLLIVLGVYVVARRLAGTGAAIMATALAAVWPELVFYSTNARGYSLIALLFLLLLVQGERLIERPSTGLWVAVGVELAIGMYTAPVMLYPGGAALAWVVVETWRRRGAPAVRTLIPRLAATVALAGALTLVLYAPVLVRYGPGPLVGNKYVVALSPRGFVAALPAFAGDIRKSLGLGMPIALIALVAVAAACGAAWPREERRRRLALAASVLGWCLLLLVVTRRPPPARVWLFLVPLGCVYAGMGLSLALRQLASAWRVDARATCAVAALALASIVATIGIRSRAVLNNVETGLLTDAPQIASWLLERLRPGDRVLVQNPSDHPLDYSLLRRGHRRLKEINAGPATGRVYVIVEPRHLQTLESVRRVQRDVPWSSLVLQTPVDTFAHARAYTFAPPRPP